MNIYIGIIAACLSILVLSCEPDLDIAVPLYAQDSSNVFRPAEIPDHISLFYPTTNDNSRFSTPSSLRESGFSIQFNRGLRLASPKISNPQLDYTAAYPVVNRSNALSGFAWKVHGSSEIHFVNYESLVENLTSEKINCGNIKNLLTQMFFYIEFYEYKSKPHISISKYLEKVQFLDCSRLKSLSSTIVGQYIEYDDEGYADGVVAYEHTVQEPCGPSDNPYNNNDTNNSEDDINPSTSNGGNSSKAATAARNLRKFLEKECGYNPLEFGRINHAAGDAFEVAVLKGLGFTQNTQPYDSPVRDNLTNGVKTQVQPDFVGQGMWMSEEAGVMEVAVEYYSGFDISDDIHFYPDAIFGEIKAYSSTVALSTSDNQIVGEIDALAEEFANNPDPSNGIFSPSYYLFTIGEISPEISKYCTKRGVQFFHGVVNVTSNNSVEIVSILHKNDVSGDFSINYRGDIVKLECPSNNKRVRIDPETLDDRK